MVQRMLDGVQVQTSPLAADMYAGIDFQAEFLKQRLTSQLLRKEQYLPSNVIDRGSVRSWQDSGNLDTFARAKNRVDYLVNDYQYPDLDPDKVKELTNLVSGLAKDAGLERLPKLDFGRSK